MCQISSFMAAAEGPVAEFSGFANFEQKKRKSNLSMSFPKIVNQMGSFGQKRKNIFFRFCRPILDIFGFTLLSFARGQLFVLHEKHVCSAGMLWVECFYEKSGKTAGTERKVVKSVTFKLVNARTIQGFLCRKCSSNVLKDM